MIPLSSSEVSAFAPARPLDVGGKAAAKIGWAGAAAACRRRRTDERALE
jgi:hypothetical protein